MKRILAMVLSMTITMSMFSPVVYATDEETMVDTVPSEAIEVIQPQEDPVEIHQDALSEQPETAEHTELAAEPVEEVVEFVDNQEQPAEGLTIAEIEQPATEPDSQQEEQVQPEPIVEPVEIQVTDTAAKDARAVIDEGSCGDNATYVLYDDGQLVISGKGKINGSAFYTWMDNQIGNKIKSIVIDDNITEIGSSAFKGLKNVTSVKLPVNLVTIGYEAFYNCDSLTKITIPSKVTTMESDVFENCDNLEKVIIPESVKSMGSNCFAFCPKLKTAGPVGGGYNIEFGWTNEIPENAFYSYYYDDNTIASYLEKIVVPDGITKIGNAFAGNKLLSKVIIPASVTEMGWNVFYNCPKLKTAGPIGSGSNIEFGWTTIIPANAFSRGNALTKITFPKGVKEIGGSAFSGCTAMEKITVPSSVVKIGSEAFYNCKNLSKISVPKSVTEMGWGVFRGCDKIVSAGPAGSGANYEFGWTTEIPDYAFSYLSNLTKVTFPSNLKYLGDNAFASCSSLEKVTLPDTLLEMGYSAFDGCTSLKTVNIPSKVKELNGVFRYCTTLETIVIPDSVTHIWDVFDSCTNLKNITFSKNLEYIGWGTFYGCTSLESISIPSKVRFIDSEAFKGCYNLKTVYIPVSVEQIYKSAFEGCSDITDVYYAGTKAQWGNIKIGNINDYLLDANIHYNAVVCTVRTGTVSNGTISLSRGMGYKGNTVSVTATPDTGYRLKTIKVDGKAISGNSFKISGNHIVTAEFEAIKYKMTVGAAENGTIKLTTTSPKEGDIVTVTATPYYGYKLKTIYVDGNAIRGETFIVSGNHTVTAEFVVAEISPLPDVAVIRVKGKTRYQTSYAIADTTKQKMGVDKFDTIIIASGENFADALAGSYLAKVKNAPIVMANGKNNPDIVNYVRFNLAQGGTVYILGGTAAVPQSTEDVLTGFNVKRLKGKSRYETNIEILKEAGVTNEEIIVATGTGFADSLSASAAGKPILLVDGKKELTQVQKDYLGTLGTEKFYIVGGTGAVAEGYETALAVYGSVERVKGKSRYETSVAIAEKFFASPDYAVIAYAENFPDGLCGGPLAMTMDAPLILTKTGKQAAAKGYMQAKGIESGAVLGGASLIDDATAKDIFRTSEIIVK